MTVGELINVLQQYDKTQPVWFRLDDGKKPYVVEHEENGKTVGWFSNYLHLNEIAEVRDDREYPQELFFFLGPGGYNTTPVIKKPNDWEWN